MNTASPSTAPVPPRPAPAVRVFGVGDAGLSVLDLLIGGGAPPEAFVGVNTDSAALAASSALEKIQIEAKPARGLGSGDPDRGRALAEAQGTQFKSRCEGASVVFLVAGLGGAAGTGITPVIARAAKEAGALVLAFVTTPFDCEGTRRQQLAQQGLADLGEVADGVICLPNEKVLKLISEDTTLLSTFKLTGELLADGLRGIWSLVEHKGLIEIHLEDLCRLIRDRESVFATAEAMGPTRSAEVVARLLAHPLLDQGQILAQADTVLVSIIGGTDLAMAEVNRVMQELKSKSPSAQVIMGAAVDGKSSDRLAVTLIASRKSAAGPASDSASLAKDPVEDQWSPRVAPAKPNSRIVPPPPTLSPETIEQILIRQGGAPRTRKNPRFRQTQLPLEIVSKGRFDKSEPTIHKGEDLDVPTYIRRGVSLN